MPGQTAILLFSRSAGHADAARLGRGATRALIERAKRVAQKSGLDLIHLSEREQRGATFGIRIANAIATAFDRGYARLLVIGHDCPTLTASYLRSVAKRMEDGRSFVGPDRRGGAWLIGLQRSHFSRAHFVDLPWQTSKLYAALTELLPGAEALARRSDLNHTADLLRHRFRLRAILGALLAALEDRPKLFSEFHQSAERLLAVLLRGPPVERA